MHRQGVVAYSPLFSRYVTPTSSVVFTKTNLSHCKRSNSKPNLFLLGGNKPRQITTKTTTTTTSTAATATRAVSSKSYLDTWVGSSQSTKNNNYQNPKLQQQKHSFRSDLLVSGSTYMIPTLRLEISDTPETISPRLQQQEQQQQSFDGGNDDVKSCPIILDLSAWAPDGSPHYTQPPKGRLTQIVQLLNQHGLTVVGLCSVGNNTPLDIQQEAASKDLQLPFLWSRPNNNSNTKGQKFILSDFVHMLQNSSKKTTESDLTKSSSSSSSSADDKPLSIINSNGKDVTSPSQNASVIDTSKNVEDEDNDDDNDDNDNDDKGNDDDDDDDDNLDQATSPTTTTTISTPTTSSNCTVYHGSVRSGQQISSEKGQSLIVIGSVSSGGEVLSDGDIVILGSLRGRALAGLSGGSNNSKIVATHMDPELLCIGTTLTTIDQMEDYELQPGQSAMVSLNNDNNELVFKAITIS